MRDAMLQGTLAFGVLAIALIGLAGIAIDDRAVVLFSILAAMLGYFSQLAGAFYEGSYRAPFLLLANWLGWILSCCSAVTAFMILFGA